MAYLHGLLDGLPGDDARGLDTDTLPAGGLDGAGAVDGIAEGVDDAAEELSADGHVDDGAGTLDDISLLDQLVVTLK